MTYNTSNINTEPNTHTNEPNQKEQQPEAPRENFFIEVVKVIILALAIIIPVRYFLIQPFYVRGASMEPNFYDYEYLIIDEISYRFREPQRGEVIVIRDPRNPKQYFIKRVIGLPGEKIKIRDGGVWITNNTYPEGFFLNETEYLPEDLQTSGDRIHVLKDEDYFLLGDNRPASLDSRSIGPVPRKKIIGRVWLRAWPLRRATTIHRITYPASETATENKKNEVNTLQRKGNNLTMISF
ncbi:MAG: signal peptidase I [Candidatus Kerfeldbacteria bacterium RIFCSPHIGHO2_02_FULL_42_14]|uniref:Signal peptidase I n=1 Tax=Candidatus Kerfeldbacteria bacterium RIFCSPHIGHO2_02_FULL_42_14 TaxID=1798540 RepID=A0A1G2AQW3_9BACT|nr:MAG: signal peptidase I [Candidatus Kerfeldbacteria bacterium RIFCSPHIGHO2_02_FULL_42_14]